MIRLTEKIKGRMGPLWWYSAVLFVALRTCDVINAFIGLWLVPRYVPQGELGAVLPLTQVGCVLGLPLTVLLVPFTKFLNTYATRGEFGKVKRLLRDVIILSTVLFFGTLVYARLFMPLVFERMRVADGSLGLLIVASGVLATVSPIYLNALQALKRFRTIAFVSLLSAPLRLVTMLICMPIRALSGYFVGQSAPSVFMIFAAVFGLRRQLDRHVKSAPYWLTDWRPIIGYTIPVAVYVAAGTFQAMVETFVIRHRLPDMDSAGYYVISRFAEMGGYVGLTLVFVLFPLVAENHEQGGKSHRLLWQSMGGALGSGLLLAAVFQCAGKWLLGLSPAWVNYVPYASHLALLTVILTVRAMCGCFVNFEMACGRFGFVSYCAVAAAIESLILYGLTGYGFFEGLLPSGWVDWMESLHAARLDFLLMVMLGVSLSVVLCILVQLTVRLTRVR